MRPIKRYAVVPVGCDVSEFIAIFGYVAHAEDLRDVLNNDPDYGCDVAVVRVTIDADVVKED